MQVAILDAGLKMERAGFDPLAKRQITAIIGPLAALCWAAGQKSVAEANAHGLDVRDLK